MSTGAPIAAEATLRRLDAATAELDPPFAVIDLEAFRANASDLVRRAGGTPVRVASKSIRIRALIAQALDTAGFRGVMAYSLPEALWLVESHMHDILMGYPSTHREALSRLARDARATAAITLMVDDLAHLDLVDALVPPHSPGRQPIRVCLDVDASLRIGGMHLGVRRSPLRTPTDVQHLARAIAARPAFRLVGVMFYEAQVAGLPDTSPAVAWVKRRSLADLATRRGAVVEAVQAVLGRELEIVNGGGSGSVQLTAADPVVTEVTAGSGLLVPTLFDRYRTFTPRPAAWFALPVVRRPARGIRTLYGGGYIASGPASSSRLPRPTLPAGLRLIGNEGAGEVQTPVRGAAAEGLTIGDRVWFRHAKSGELFERFAWAHGVEGDRLVSVTPTYRGEGRSFG